MKILGVCGSHRKGGSSFVLLEEAMSGVKDVDASAETKIIELATLKICPCISVCPAPCGEKNPLDAM